MQLSQQLDEWKGSFSEEHSLDEDIYLPQKALGVIAFLESAGVCNSGDDLPSLCEAVHMKALSLINTENNDWDDYYRRQEDEIWDSKDYYNASDIAHHMKLSSGAKANKLLESLGYQTRQNKGWVATEKALSFCEQLGIGENQQPYIRWQKSILEKLL